MEHIATGLWLAGRFIRSIDRRCSAGRCQTIVGLFQIKASASAEFNIATARIRGRECRDLRIRLMSEAGWRAMTGRRTIVVHTRLGGHMVRVEAARAGANGVRVLAMGHLAARLAAGSSNRSIRRRGASGSAFLRRERPRRIGSDQGPAWYGGAVVGTLNQVWRAGIELSTASHPRLRHWPPWSGTCCDGCRRR